MPAPARIHLLSLSHQIIHERNRRRMRSANKHLKEARKLQKMVKPLLKKTPFNRVVREIIQTEFRADFHAEDDANEALREAADMYLHWLMDMTVHAAEHSGRKTIMVEDMRLVRSIANKDRPVTFY